MGAPRNTTVSRKQSLCKTSAPAGTARAAPGAHGSRVRRVTASPGPGDGVTSSETRPSRRRKRVGALVPRPNPPPRLWRPGVRDAAPTGSGDTCLPGRLRARGARRRGRETDRCRQRRRSTVPGEWEGGCRGGRCRLPTRAPGAAAHSPPAPARWPRAAPRSCEASATPPCGPGPGTGAAVRVSREGARVCLRESVSVAVCVCTCIHGHACLCVCAHAGVSA